MSTESRIGCMHVYIAVCYINYVRQKGQNDPYFGGVEVPGAQLFMTVNSLTLQAINAPIASPGTFHTRIYYIYEDRKKGRK